MVGSDQIDMTKSRSKLGFCFCLCLLFSSLQDKVTVAQAYPELTSFNVRQYSCLFLPSAEADVRDFDDESVGDRVFCCQSFGVLDGLCPFGAENILLVGSVQNLESFWKRQNCGLRVHAQSSPLGGELEHLGHLEKERPGLQEGQRCGLL